MKSKLNTSNSSTPESAQVYSDLLEKIQIKLIEIEQRRKVWDDTMAEIFNEKKIIQENLKIKMKRIDDVEEITKKEIEDVKKLLKERLNSIE